MAGAALLYEIRKVLEAYATNAKPESMFALRDLLEELDRTEALKDLGCNSECPSCRFGKAEAEPWENHCRILGFLEKVQDEDVGRKRGNSLIQREARVLLASLDSRDR
ncbi:MAG: hypothetical protein AB1347_06625 [Acidobacteriota bacterium]